MGKLLLATTAAILMMAATARAEDDTVDTVSNNGDYAIMGSGSVYHSTDGTDFTGWQGDDVVIDGDQMIDTDSGDQADVEQVR